MEANNATTDDAQTQKEMRKFKQQVRDAGIDKIGAYGEPQTDGGELPPRNPNKNFGTRPMTGQPRTYDSLTIATQRANAELSGELNTGEISKGFDPIMHVTEDGETEDVFKVDWFDRRDTRDSVWKRLERNPEQCYVRVANWFNDATINKVTGSTQGFYGEKVDETEKAYQFKTQASGHSAGTETFWMPKKAAQLYELEQFE